MFRRLSPLLSFLVLSAVAVAAEPPPDILKTDLMVVVAHPDDESMVAGVMARYAQEQGKTIACIYATRGEGGGNAVGTQLGPALGQLREAELRECLGLIGVRHVYFLDKTDWAYTESAAATLQKWGHDDSLGRLVRLVRNLRPEVMVTFFPAPAGGQHGHHQTAGLLATEAFDSAGDPDAFPDQIKSEGLRPWQPRKLYYVRQEPGSVEVATDGKAKDGRAWAQIGMEAESHHRSQGWGGFSPSPGPFRPQYFTLAKSALPADADAKKDDLLEGLDEGRELLATLEPVDYRYASGGTGQLRLVLTNGGTEKIAGLKISPAPSAAWKIELPAAVPTDLEPGRRAVLELSVRAPESFQGGSPDVPLSLRVSWEGSQGPRNSTVTATVREAPDVTAEIEPLPGIARYRDWARANRIERFADALPSWVPLAAGQSGTVKARLIRRNGTGGGTGYARLIVPEGWRSEPDAVEADMSRPQAELIFHVTPPSSAPVADVPLKLEVRTSPAPNGPLAAQAAGVAQVTPFAEAARASSPRTIDGKLDDWDGAETLAIPHGNLVQGEFRDDADGSATVRVAYDDRYLYVAAQVRDDVVVSNIAPDDIKAHWRSDSIEIDVDPSPRSESTLTTFKMGVFPWDSSGHVRAERDADANQGLIEETAPGTKIASQRAADGYVIETAIPWSAIGALPKSGSELGFNVILFDGDKKDARIGDDINEGRLAWSYRPGIWGRPEQWGDLRLQ
jgi:LmbE family N-acetylglucosaminyl deacetylase